MTDPNTFQAMQTLFHELNRQLGDVETLEEPSAEDILSYFGERGGHIHPVDKSAEVRVHHTPVNHLNNWDDPWPVTYGIDGSTTRPLGFHNGLILASSVGKLGVNGSTPNAELEQETTLTTVAYLNESEVSLDNIDLGVPNVESNVFSFPPCDRPNNIREWVVTLSRTHAEGAHARHLVEDLDGPLFYDGPLYPSRIFNWMLFDQAGSPTPTPMKVWPEMVEDILTNYIKTIERMNRKGLPVVGVTKTTSSSRAITALERKLDGVDAVSTPLPWNDDYQLFSDALHTPADRYGNEGEIISYTPWFVQKQHDVGETQELPFEGTNIRLKYGDPVEYQRAFFYVRPPLGTNVMRVEAPYIYVKDKAQRDTLQAKVLAEMGRKEPPAIGAADTNARINKEHRDMFRQIISSEAEEDYNEERGYADLGPEH